ncbi:MAG: carbamoyltransferase HypF [Actinomycetia bacterium]|nr:carbamoyltransferase HypF [Actinomycetes bacterium]
MKAIEMHITGVVQGVGFRPFVYTLARTYHLTGWVRNDSDGVHVVVEGPAQLVDAFVAAFEDKAPPASRIEHIAIRPIEPADHATFEIRASQNIEGERTLISPDRALCEECEAELFDPKDRRSRYPFINCTNCGPRFTIIEDIPYDRSATPMRDFPLCEACQTEYSDPTDRRFHAQPDACFECGPRLYLNWGELDPHLSSSWTWSPLMEKVPRPHRDRDEEMARSNSIILEVVEALHEDKIVALKGLGGFLLCCDAKSPSAVDKLRNRKHRWGKPLAVMFPTLKEIVRYCELTQRDVELLTGAVRPIVLLRLKADAPDDLAPGIAPGLHELGVMLPYTPLHALILDEFGGPLVMTSGNMSEEPICTDNAQALEKLAPIADAILLHDRDIFSRYDDSVVRVVDGKTYMLRRARGFAPEPLHTAIASPSAVLAVGPEQKNTFTLLQGNDAFTSQHIGDLESIESLESFEEAEALYEHLFRIKPQVVAHDLHPEYLSTKWADALARAEDVRLIGVQHHHAHVASVAAEHSYTDPVIGFALDGTGYGEDGTIWGGEVLIADQNRYQRFASLRPFPLPGGAAAVKRPARTAVGLLHELDLLGHPGARFLLSRLAEDEQSTIVTMIEQDLNSPKTSSAGRLFDAVAALIGVADDAAYEGSAAILLESMSLPLGEIGPPLTYRFVITEADDTATSEQDIAPNGRPIPPYAKARYLIDPEPVIAAILDDLDRGVEPKELSRRFHFALVTLIGEMATKAARESGLNTVVLGGGCFMNRMLLERTVKTLQDKGLYVLVAEKLPVNDGGVSFGQAVVASTRLELERVSADTEP